MELNLQRRVAGLDDKMPDIQKTLETVRFLKTRTVCGYTGDGRARGTDIEMCHRKSQTRSRRPSNSTTRCMQRLRYHPRMRSTCGSVYVQERYFGVESVLTGTLQANVMLSYPIDEAETLLEQKLSAAKQSLANCEEDLDFLREQITVRLSCDASDAGLLIEYRLWRWQLHEYITGTWYKSGKTRQMRKAREEGGKATASRKVKGFCEIELAPSLEMLRSHAIPLNLLLV